MRPLSGVDAALIMSTAVKWRPLGEGHLVLWRLPTQCYLEWRLTREGAWDAVHINNPMADAVAYCGIRADDARFIANAPL